MEDILIFSKNFLLKKTQSQDYDVFQDCLFSLLGLDSQPLRLLINKIIIKNLQMFSLTLLSNLEEEIFKPLNLQEQTTDDSIEEESAADSEQE